MQHKDSWSWSRRTFMKSSLLGALLIIGKLLDPSAAHSEAIPNCQAASESDAIQKSEALPSCLPWQEPSASRKSRLGYQLCPGRILPNAGGGAENSNSMVSSSLASPKPPYGGEQREQGDKTNEPELRIGL